MTTITLNSVLPMTSDDKPFFVALGGRIAALRKDRGWTQQELAEQIGIAQQTLAHYEGARLRVPASMLPTLAGLLQVGVDELIGQPAKRSNKRGPAPRLAQHMEMISQLPKTKQRFVMEVIENMLAQQGR